MAGDVSAAARSAARPDAARGARSARPWTRTAREFFSRGSAIWGASLTAAVLLLVAIGPFLARYPPIDFVGAPFESPSLDMPLGADIMGRDVLSRVLSGGTVILSLSALATVLGVALGGLLGISAGYLKGAADDLIMRTLDVLLAFPAEIDHPFSRSRGPNSQSRLLRSTAPQTRGTAPCLPGRRELPPPGRRR